MRICLHRWELMGAGSLFTKKKKCFETSFLSQNCKVLVRSVRSSGNSFYQKSAYDNDYYHAFAFANIPKVQMEVFNTSRGTLRM